VGSSLSRDEIICYSNWPVMSSHCVKHGCSNLNSWSMEVWRLWLWKFWDHWGLAVIGTLVSFDNSELGRW